MVVPWQSKLEKERKDLLQQQRELPPRKMELLAIIYFMLGEYDKLKALVGYPPKKNMPPIARFILGLSFRANEETEKAQELIWKLKNEPCAQLYMATKPSMNPGTDLKLQEEKRISKKDAERECR